MNVNSSCVVCWFITLLLASYVAIFSKWLDDCLIIVSRLDSSRDEAIMLMQLSIILFRNSIISSNYSHSPIIPKIMLHPKLIVALETANNWVVCYFKIICNNFPCIFSNILLKNKNQLMVCLNFSKLNLCIQVMQVLLHIKELM